MSWMRFCLNPRVSRRAVVRSRRRPTRPPGYRPQVEGLENRCVPSTVTNLNDAGPGSLRDAIANTPAGGTVGFRAGLTGTITLTSATLTIDHSLTINGSGANALAVSGGHQFTVLAINSPMVSAAVTGLSIINGVYNSFNGAGGIINSGLLTLTACTVSGNADGGILNQGTLTLTACTVSGNVSAFDHYSGAGTGGGGITNSGTLTVSASTLSGNSTVGVPCYKGGPCGGGYRIGSLPHRRRSGTATSSPSNRGCLPCKDRMANDVAALPAERAGAVAPLGRSLCLS